MGATIIVEARVMRLGGARGPPGTDGLLDKLTGRGWGLAGPGFMSLFVECVRIV